MEKFDFSYDWEDTAKIVENAKTDFFVYENLTILSSCYLLKEFNNHQEGFVGHCIS